VLVEPGRDVGVFVGGRSCPGSLYVKASRNFLVRRCTNNPVRRAGRTHRQGDRIVLPKHRHQEFPKFLPCVPNPIRDLRRAMPITNAIATLLTHGEQLELLQARPDLITSAVEEILRYTGTIGGTKPNYAAEDVELHGVTIPRGAPEIPLLTSANRDSDVFDQPDDFDITRNPNHHIAFGKGAHFCLGAPTSPGWKPASRSPTSSPDSPTCAWRSNPPT
jgi:Cytochrome P450